MNEDVKVRFFLDREFWRYEISYGTHRILGSAVSLEDAEIKSQETIGEIEGHSIVHKFYENVPQNI